MQNIQFLVDTHSKFPCVGHGLHFWQGLRRNFDLSTWPNIKHQSLARSHKSQGCVCHTANQTWKVNYNSVDLWCWQIPALVGLFIPSPCHNFGCVSSEVAGGLSYLQIAKTCHFQWPVWAVKTLTSTICSKNLMHVHSSHVQYTQTESIRQRHFTTRLDSHGVASRVNRLPAWQIDNGGNDSCWFGQIESNRQQFQATLHSPPEVKIREIMIHKPSLFLKRGHKLQSIRTIRVDAIESSRIDNIFNPPCIVQGRYMFKVSRKSTSGMTNRQQGKRFIQFDRIKSNWQHFQATLHSPLEVKIHEIMIHEPSSILKRGHKLQLIRKIRVDLIELSRIDNIFNPP